MKTGKEFPFYVPDSTWKIAVASRSFSRNPTLRSELLGKYPHSTFNDAGVSLRGDALKTFLHGHDAAIIALEPIDNEVLEVLPQLKIISKYGVGLDTIDFKALQKYNVRLAWVGGVNRRSVAELTLGFMLTCLRGLNHANLKVRQGIWEQHYGNLLSSKRVGIIGLGHVGKDLAKLLAPFNCTIYANDLKQLDHLCPDLGVEQVSLSHVLSRSDIVSIHVPLTTLTRGLLGREQLQSMRSGSILINTARGGIVDEQALKECLQIGHLSAAAFDVFASEPPVDDELLALPNFLATPHIGGSAQEAILAMGRATIAQIESSCDPIKEMFN